MLNLSISRFCRCWTISPTQPESFASSRICGCQLRPWSLQKPEAMLISPSPTTTFYNKFKTEGTQRSELLTDFCVVRVSLSTIITFAAEALLMRSMGLSEADGHAFRVIGQSAPQSSKWASHIFLYKTPQHNWHFTLAASSLPACIDTRKCASRPYYRRT